jgi:hypothetical protein
MALPEDLLPHAAPADATGTIHFRDAYSYLQDGDASWALLQMDSPFSGVLNFTMAAQTANRLENSYDEGDPATLHGVMTSLTYNNAPLRVLFLC